MPDFLNKAADWLARTNRDHVSQSVYYVRGASVTNLRAKLGRSEFQSVDAEGFGLRTETVDFIVHVDELEIDGEASDPAVGDRILLGEPGSARVYQVTAPPENKCFRFDGHRREIRIHTQYIGPEQPTPE